MIEELPRYIRALGPRWSAEFGAAVLVVEGEEIPVVSIRDLIALELRAKRRQDLSDVLHLKTVL